MAKSIDVRSDHQAGGKPATVEPGHRVGKPDNDGDDRVGKDSYGPHSGNEPDRGTR